MKTDATRKMYYQFLIKYYLSHPPNNSLSLKEILAKDHKTIEQEIITIISNMRNVRRLSYSSTLTFLCAITLFFEISDVTFNKEKVGKFRRDNIAKFEYKAYTHGEISTLISFSDERGKAMLLLMASTGMRVGALPALKLKHLKKWTIGEGSNQFVYQARVYVNSPRYRYSTFCSPECVAALDRYFSLRKRCGENLKQDPTNGDWEPGDSHVFIKNFSKESFPIICS